MRWWSKEFGCEVFLIILRKRLMLREKPSHGATPEALPSREIQMHTEKQGPVLKAGIPNLEGTATSPGHLVGGGAQDSAFLTNSQVLLVCKPVFEDGDASSFCFDWERV